MLCRRVAKSTGASVVTTLADMDGTESFDASSLGQCDEVPATQPCMLSTLCTNLCHASAACSGSNASCLRVALLLSLMSISAINVIITIIIIEHVLT